jgi:gluconolactonase
MLISLFLQIKGLISLAVLLFFIFTVFACAQQEDSSWLMAEGTSPEVIADGFRFTEGPFWHPDGYLIFSDIPANTVYRWTESGDTSVFLDDSGNSNGITMDPRGNIVLAQHAGRVSRLGEDGSPVPIIQEFDGMRLNSPNDLVYHSDGTLFFTDPDFGVSAEQRELDFTGVYRLGPDGDISLIYTDFDLPNGITLSPDETRLYVNDTATGDIVRFDLDEAGRLSEPARFAGVGARSDSGAADGMKTDTDGRLYSTGPGGLHIFDPDGNRLLMIPFDQAITNLAWGGQDRNELYITSSDKVYRLKTNVTGNR